MTETSWLSMEMYTAGTLMDVQDLYWKNPPLLGTTVPEGLLWHIIAQLTETLLALNFGIINGEKNNDLDIVAHCDLHGNNVMLRWPGKAFGDYPDVIITDFGLSIRMASDMADKERADLMYRCQIRDLTHLMDVLWTLISKSDGNRETLIRVFDALWQERSVTRAGARIGLSQPAVSAALERLRHALNDSLFVRRGNLMVPTPRAFWVNVCVASTSWICHVWICWALVEKVPRSKYNISAVRRYFPAPRPDKGLPMADQIVAGSSACGCRECVVEGADS